MDKDTAKRNYDVAHREMGEATRAYLDAVQVSLLTGRTSNAITAAKARVTAARSAMDGATADYNSTRVS